jgi:hypothetical protein
MDNVNPCRRCGRFVRQSESKRLAAVKANKRGWVCRECFDEIKRRGV